VHADDGLQLELRGALVEHDEALLAERHAIGQSKPVDVTLYAAGPRAQAPNSSRLPSTPRHGRKKGKQKGVAT